MNSAEKKKKGVSREGIFSAFLITTSGAGAVGKLISFRYCWLIGSGETRERCLSRTKLGLRALVSPPSYTLLSPFPPPAVHGMVCTLMLSDEGDGDKNRAGSRLPGP